MVVAYIRVFGDYGNIIDDQKNILEQYCKEHNLVLEKTFIDIGKPKARLRKNARVLGNIGYVESYDREYTYPEFDEMFLLIAEGKVKKVLVDTKYRLMVNPYTDHFFKKLCESNEVEIIEVGTYLPNTPPPSLGAVIYHDIDHSPVHSTCAIRDIDSLYNVVHLNRWTALTAILDESRGSLKRHRFIWLMENLVRYDIMVAKSLLNISTKSAQVIQALLLLKQNNVTLYTLSSGEVSIHLDKLVFDMELKAVIYDSFSQTEEETELLEKIANTFVECKTKWKVQEYFCEGHRVKLNEDHNGLYKLLKQQQEFDVIIVHSFRRVCERTTRFEKILHMLDDKKMIYSIEEGGYLYGKK